VSQTQHPFGDPAGTQYHRDAELIAELRRRATAPPSYREPPSGLAPVQGEIRVRRMVEPWTVAALALLVITLGACLALALSL